MDTPKAEVEVDRFVIWQRSYVAGGARLVMRARRCGKLAGVVTMAEVSRLALELPQVVEGERRGTLTWAVEGKTFAWERPFSKADIKRFGTATPPQGPILAVRVEDLGDKEAVLAANPKAFFTIPHFDGFSAVLVHLKLASKKAVKEALVDGWLACAPPKLAAQFLAH